MSMQMEDLENKMKDIQFMKVTREIQAVSNTNHFTCDGKKGAFAVISNMNRSTLWTRISPQWPSKLRQLCSSVL